MNTTRKTESELLAALARFEKNLETPVIPGELPTWLRDTLNSFETVQRLLLRDVPRRHERLLADITREDMELAPRVTQMQETDEELVAESEELSSDIHQLVAQAEGTESHEAKLETRIEKLTKRGLRFVIAVRTQEQALTTWYLEALNRDRGPVD